MSELGEIKPHQSMQIFRRRIDAFFGDPRTAQLADRLGPPPAPRPPTTAAAAIRSPLRNTLTRLGFPSDDNAISLDKSLTMHGGSIIAVTGDATPMRLGADVRVVTVTTTVLERNNLRVESSFHVFSRGGA